MPFAEGAFMSLVQIMDIFCRQKKIRKIMHVCTQSNVTGGNEMQCVLNHKTSVLGMSTRRPFF